MKKILYLLASLLFIVGCESYKDINYSELKEATVEADLDSFLESNHGVELIYQFLEDGIKYLKADLRIYEEDYYLIEFSSNDVFLFNKVNQKCYHYNGITEELDAKEDIYQFIEMVEEIKEIKFRLFDYLAFEVLQELLAEDFTDTLRYTKGSGGAPPSFRTIHIKKSDVANFPLLEKVYDDLLLYQNETNIYQRKDSVNFRIHIGNFYLAINGFKGLVESSTEFDNNNIQEIEYL